MRSGAVLILAGVWLVARTVTHDDSGRNLVDRILGAGGTSSAGTTAGTTTAIAFPHGARRRPAPSAPAIARRGSGRGSIPHNWAGP